MAVTIFVELDLIQAADGRSFSETSSVAFASTSEAESRGSLVLDVLVSSPDEERALAVYESQPVLFDSIRGVVRVLYGMGSMALIVLLVVSLLVGVVRRDGVVDRRLGWGTLVFVALSIVVGAVTSLDAKTLGAAVFLVPAVLGYSYWKNGADPADLFLHGPGKVE